MPSPVYDPRTSPRNQALIGTRSTLAYLPHALRWACSAEVVLVALPMGALIGMFAVSWLAPVFLAFLGTLALSWLLALYAHTVDGHGVAPPMTADQLNPMQRGPRSLVECVGFAFALYVGLGVLGGVETARGFAYAFGALLPTLFALVAMTDSLWRSLRPGIVFRFLRAGGLAGIVIAAAFAVVNAFVFDAAARWFSVLDATGLSDIMQSWVPNPLWMVFGALALWVLAFCAHVHAHALHHHRDVAAVEVSISAADDAELEAQHRRAAVARVAAQLDDASAREDGVLVARLAAERQPDGVDEYFYLCDLWDEMLRRKRFPAAVKVARRLIRVAAERKRIVYALEVLTEAKRLSPGYEPGARVRLALARALLANRDDATFERISAYDGEIDDDAVELAFLRASWLADKRGDNAAAVALLDKVRDREHPLKERITRLHAMLVGLPGLEPGTKRL